MPVKTADQPAGGHLTQIFLLEDDSDISRLVVYHLEAAGYQVHSYSTISSFMPDAEEARPSLMLLDIMVPDGDGLDLCRHIRRTGGPLAQTPIIFLTAKSSEVDRITGLETGADDYVTKPFSPNELIARIRSVLRRSGLHQPDRLELGELEIDVASMIVKVRGEIVNTTTTEFRLLCYLAQHAGRVFTREQLLDAVWRDTAFVSPRSVDVYVRKLREKIERDPDSPQLLITVRGAGYRFELPKRVGA
jgi:two-component system phosphate regulon response regulator PhoB